MTKMRWPVGLAMCLAILVSAAGAQAREIVWWDGSEDPGSIVVSTQDRRLYFVLGAGEAIEYDIAVGREGMQWFGTTTVVNKAKNPTWRPTARMRKENPKLPAVVGPGRSNPMGTRAIYLAEGLLRIHGTNAPKSIGKAASSGCYRMRNADVEHLYELVGRGATVYVD
jgi:lipoprotein-anchoring transpeptidase ErfK/SrfK